MDKLSEIPKHRPFTFQEFITAGLTRHRLDSLLNSGEIERISRGIYRFSDTDLTYEDQFKAAIEQVGKPAAICLLSALSYFELTDIIPGRIWVMVPAEKRTKLSNLELYRTRTPKWNIGITQAEGFPITSIERTIVDVLTSRRGDLKHIGPEALKRALATKLVSLGQVFDMATVLKKAKVVSPYIEALS